MLWSRATTSLSLPAFERTQARSAGCGVQLSRRCRGGQTARGFSTNMKKTVAYSAIAAMLCGMFYAPFFHVHMEAGEPLVHSHLPEIETAADGDAENVLHIEQRHSHATARAIDILITTATLSIHLENALISTGLIRDVIAPCCGFVSLATPRAHGPPPVAAQIPRAPPA